MAIVSARSRPRGWIILLALLAVVPTIGLALVVAVEQWVGAAARVEADAVRLAGLAAGVQARAITGARELLAVATTMPELRRQDAAACGPALAEALRHAPGYVNLVALQADGSVLCSAAGGGAAPGLADRRAVRLVLDTRRPGPAEHGAEPLSGRPALLLAVPLGETSGALVGALDPAWLGRVLADVAVAEQGALTVVDHRGTVVARVPEPEPWVGTAVAGTPLGRVVLAGRPGPVEETGLDGIRRLYAVAPVSAPGAELVVAAGLSRRHLLAQANQRLVGHVVALGVVAALALGAAWIGGRRLASLTATAEGEQQARQALVDQVSELVGQRAREVSLLNQMGGLLEACLTVEEAAAVIGRLAPQCFPGARGALCLIEPERHVAERVAHWGAPTAAGPATFPPGDCWALRRGQAYTAPDTTVAPPCGHLGTPAPAATLCVPLVAQGEALGLLHLAAGVPGVPGSPGEPWQRLATTVAEHLALAIANLRLRATLRAQSIRDPLTGLFNRRYMEETLERELRRAERDHHPVGILVLDVDHFKRVNDTFGHDGGDAVLAGLGTLLAGNTRGGDIACRLGGEEFVLILPGASLDESRRRAQELLEAARDFQVTHRGQLIGPVTFSAGVAAFPDHGPTREAVLRAADTAVYRAKREGRNTIAAAD
jgi:diguanylate cyclase (GGDEF)-like protein